MEVSECCGGRLTFEEPLSLLRHLLNELNERILASMVTAISGPLANYASIKSVCEPSFLSI